MRFTYELANAEADLEVDRAEGLKELRRLDKDLKRRGNMIRESAAKDFAEFQKLNDPASMPNMRLTISGFREFFTPDDSVAQDAALLLDRLVRQGGMLGLHITLE